MDGFVNEKDYWIVQVQVSCQASQMPAMHGCQPAAAAHDYMDHTAWWIMQSCCVAMLAMNKHAIPVPCTRCKSMLSMLSMLAVDAWHAWHAWYLHDMLS